jgi:glycosyltransferase involved in cell wall biosynthesis
MSTHPAKLSVVTIALNEEHNIIECLRSVQWADELIVVDSGSTDRTVELARSFPARVLQVQWHGYGRTKNEALQHATGDWILWLDADERITAALAEEIKSTIRSNSSSVAGYTMPRKAFFLGKWIRHCGWYPSRVTRLFRRDKGRFSENQVHEELVLDGITEDFQNDILHYTDPDLYHYFHKFNRYTSLAAKDMHDAGRRFRLYDLLVRPPFTFVKMFLLRRGFLDGIHGLVLSVASSTYVFVKYAKLWEIGKHRHLAQQKET